MIREPVWHDALEPSQVLAGLVSYPSDNPVYLYSTRAWTLLHQLLALALRVGCSEETLTLVLSGVVGMLSLQALAMVILALCEDTAISIVGAFFIYATGASEGGVNYPVNLMGVPYSYGVIGLSYTLLTMGMIGAGYLRAGLFLLGLGPAIHIATGFWTIIAAAVAFSFEGPSSRRRIVDASRYFFAGAACTLGSAAIHAWQVGWGWQIPREWVAPTSEVVDRWQLHRGRFSLQMGGMTFSWITVLLSAIWLRWFLSASAGTLLRILIAAVAVGCVFSVIHWMPLRWVPAVLYALMPSRILNLPVLASMALVIGLLATRRGDVRMAAFLAILMTGWCLIASNVVFDVPTRDALIPLSLCAPVLVWLSFTSPAAESRGSSLARVIRAAGLLTPIAIAAAMSLSAVLHFHDVWGPQTSEGLFRTAAGRPGILLTATMLHQIQLHTRRAVLLDGGAMDGLVYVPDGVPATERVLRRVYGIDTLTMNKTGLSLDLIPEAHQPLWETRSADDWRDLAAEFGISDVLTPATWRLQLPVLTSDQELTLYTIR